MTPDPKPDENVLWHQSGVNQMGEPFVQLLRGMHILGQMSPEQARDHGHAILEAAEAAEQDAFLLDLLQRKVGLDLNTASVVLGEFRNYRLARSGKRGGPSNPNDWVFPDVPR